MRVSRTKLSKGMMEAERRFESYKHKRTESASAGQRAPDAWPCRRRRTSHSGAAVGHGNKLGAYSDMKIVQRDKVNCPGADVD
jgi:hypothetical protein